MKTSGLLVVLLLAMTTAQAQEGPSFDCGRAGTATERAICESPWLSRLERRTVASYEDLVQRIGRREARAFADEHLALRQACRADRPCIQDQLIASTQAFQARGRGTTEPTDDAQASVDAVAAALRDRDPAPVTGSPADEPPVLAQVLRPVARPASGPIGEAGDFLPVTGVLRDASPGLELPDQETSASLADPFVEPTPALPGDRLASNHGDGLPAIEADPGSAPMQEGQEGAIFALEAGPGPVSLPEPQAGSISVLSDAFSALPTYQRANLQGRLAEAGYGDLDPDGTWTVATATALSSLLLDASVGGLTFDPRTAEGAAALFDFIDSDRFKRDFLSEEVSAGLEW